MCVLTRSTPACASCLRGHHSHTQPSVSVLKHWQRASGSRVGTVLHQMCPIGMWFPLGASRNAGCQPGGHAFTKPTHIGGKHPPVCAGASPILSFPPPLPPPHLTKTAPHLMLTSCPLAWGSHATVSQRRHGTAPCHICPPHSLLPS